MIAVSRNAIKQTIHLFDIKIKNGQQEITEVIRYSLIGLIEIETRLFHQTIYFRNPGIQ